MKIGPDGQPLATAASSAAPVSPPTSLVEVMLQELPGVEGTRPMKGLPPLAHQLFSRWLGLADTDMVPTNMGGILQELATLLAQRHLLPEKASPQTMFEQMSPESLQAFRQWLQTAIQAYRDADDLDLDTSRFANEGVRKSLEAIQEAREKESIDPGKMARLAKIRQQLSQPVAEEDSDFASVLQAMRGESAASSPAAPAEEPPSPAVERPSVSAESVFAAETETPPESPPVSAGALTTSLRNCPRCQHDLSITEIPEDISEEDKDDFVLTSLAPRPFQKSYSLLRGRLKVRFRGLYLQEMDDILRQITIDTRKGRLAEEPMAQLLDRRVWAARYQLALQLLSVESADRAFVYAGAETPDKWAEIVEAPEGETYLRPLLLYITQHVLPSQSLYELIRIRLGEFNSLVTRLEGASLSPDF